MKQKILIFSIIIILIAVFAAIKETKAGSGDNVYGWAWAENIGWISFNCLNDYDGNGTRESHCTDAGYASNYGVDIDPSNGNFLSTSYAWSDNIGWIWFAPTDTPPGEAGPNPARLNLGINEVSGWARACAGAVNANCTGGANPAAGGWDGWIKLRGVTQGGQSYGVTFNPFPPAPESTPQFEGWAWGDSVVGWISFNRVNCDTDRNGFSNGLGDCPTAGAQISNYKVMTNLNQAPDQPTTNPNESWGYCGGDPSVNTRTTLTLNWSVFSDDDPGDYQQAYKIKIDGTSHQVTGGGSSYTVNPDDFSGVSFDWGTLHSWQVMVQDNNGNWSDWSGANSFTMPIHQAPDPSFSATPANPPAGVEVSFDEESKCYYAAGVEYDCYIEPNPYGIGVSYSWDFDDNGSTDDTTKGDTTYTYTTRADYTARLSITDDVGTCSASQPIYVRLPLPTWREVPPTF